MIGVILICCLVGFGIHVAIVRPLLYPIDINHAKYRAKPVRKDGKRLRAVRPL